MGADPLFRRSLEALAAHSPGKLVEQVQRRPELERVAQLGLNEGQFGPFPGAVQAIERGLGRLNRYPDRGAAALRNALADKHGLAPANIALGPGANGVIAYASLATLEPGAEIVTGWPSFPTYVFEAAKLGAIARRVPLQELRFDLDALLGAITTRTKLVYLCNPNNPTGTMVSRDEVDAYFERVPRHVLTVLDEAYFEYVDDPDYPDGVEEHVKAGRRVLVLRTFSKIYGLAGLRVGYGVGPADVVEALDRVRSPFDIGQTAQDAALASLTDGDEVERRRGATAEGRIWLERELAGLGLRVAGPPVANFLFVDVGEDASAVFERLLAAGVVVLPLTAFDEDTSIRVTVGNQAENELFVTALRQIVTEPARAI